MITNPALVGVPLLLIANKQDIPVSIQIWFKMKFTNFLPFVQYFNSRRYIFYIACRAGRMKILSLHFYFSIMIHACLVD